MSVGGVNGPPPATAPSETGGAVPQADIDEGINKIALNILQGGQAYVKEAMEKFFEEEEPDEDDPDAEPL